MLLKTELASPGRQNEAWVLGGDFSDLIRVCHNFKAKFLNMFKKLDEFPKLPGSCLVFSAYNVKGFHHQSFIKQEKFCS